MNPSNPSSQFAFSKGGLMPQEEKLEVGRKRKHLSIGIPKETIKDENRVPLTPLAGQLLVDNGHEVIIETPRQIGMTGSIKDELKP